RFVSRDLAHPAPRRWSCARGGLDARRVGLASAFADRAPPMLNRVRGGANPAEPTEETHPENVEDADHHPAPHVMDHRCGMSRRHRGARGSGGMCSDLGVTVWIDPAPLGWTPIRGSCG